jgi:glucose/arabinose dehydrogenase
LPLTWLLGAAIVGCGAVATSMTQVGTGTRVEPVPNVPAEADGLLTAEAANLTVRPASRDHSEALLRQLRVPAGFRVEVFAEGLEQPRIIKVAPGGHVYVSERPEGRVSLLRDTDGDGRADRVEPVATGLREGLRGVHGLAVRERQLYMVTETELYRADIRDDGTLSEPTRLRDDIPAGGQHPNRTIEVGPDGRLYLSIGSTCNACKEPKEVHATIVRLDPDGQNLEIFARGLRNTIGYAWHPVSGRLYGWDHNTDEHGQDWPPEEVNEIQEGRHYGWPWCGGNREVDPHVAENPTDDEGEDIPRPEFCARTEPPVVTYQAHTAGMQYVYYTGKQFPAEYRNDAFVTLRGSWNRNPPVGYGIARIRHDADGRPTEVVPFIDGWLLDEGRAHFGRLTGLAQAPDGALLVTNDSHGVVYRISYQKPARQQQNGAR